MSAGSTINKKWYPHWTTHLSFLSPEFAGKSYHQFAKDSCLTKAEIEAVMQSYTTGLMATFSTRNHKAKAEDIVSRCKEEAMTVAEIINEVESYLSHTHFEPNSSFKKRLDYLVARNAYHNISTEQVLS